MIRSDFVADRLKKMARNGKSQAVILEELMANVPVEDTHQDPRADLKAFLTDLAKRGGAKPRRFASMAEFDAHEYDERGNPR